MSLAPEARPLSIGDLLDAALRLYRSRFSRLLAIAAIGQFPLAALQLVIQLSGGSTRLSALGFILSPITMAFVPIVMQVLRIDMLVRSAPLLLVLCAVQYFVVQSLIAGILTSAIVGEAPGPSSVLGAYRLGARRVLAVVLAALAPFAIGGLGAWLIYPFCGWLYLDIILIFDQEVDLLWSLGDITGDPSVLVRLLVGLLALLIYARLALAPQITVLEECGPLLSMRRSWNLTGGATRRTLALLFMVGLFTSFMVMLPIRAALVLERVFRGLQLMSLSNALGVLVFIIFLLGLVPMLPLQIATQTLLYYDLRKRREGYDLEQRARRRGWM